MNTELLTFSIVQFGISMLVGITMMFIAYKLVSRAILNNYSVQSRSIAFAIIVAGILFSVVFIVASAIDPLFNAIRIAEKDPMGTDSVFITGLKYGGLYLMLCILLISLIVVFAVVLFKVITWNFVDDPETNEDNIALSLITAVIIISLTVLAKDSALLLFESFIPYPEVPNVF